MDRWILAELNDTIREVGEGLEDFDATRGGRRLDRFVDDLSNWYVRRSRRRFWRSSEDVDTRSAFLTLWECLETVARLTAPYTPFVSDEVYTNVTSGLPDAHDSVHLADWPEVDPHRDDDALRRQMALVRRLVALGRAARTEGKVRVRQPLARALLVLPAAEVPDLEGLEPLIAEELNVKEIEVARGLEELVTYSVKPNFKTLGPRFGRRVKDVAKALAGVDAHALVAELETRGEVEIDLDGERQTLGRDDLDVRVEGRSGFSLAQEAHYGVALDLDLTPALLAEGIAREVVRAVQDLRKSSGLAVEDRIELWLASTDADVQSALATHRDLIATEVLAPTAHVGEEPPGDVPADIIELDNGSATAALRRV
jgi:isoleucyl-tRNA synthetase